MITSPRSVWTPNQGRHPNPTGRYCPHNTWKETLAHRERALTQRHYWELEKWSEHTHRLNPLRVGDHVYTQNMVGNHHRRWECTGVVVVVRQFHQHAIRGDGSSRVTLHNRQHLRKYTPFLQKPTPLIPQPVMTTRMRAQQIHQRPPKKNLRLHQKPPTSHANLLTLGTWHDPCSWGLTVPTLQSSTPPTPHPTPRRRITFHNGQFLR